MPQNNPENRVHHPQDRVRVKNIVNLEEDDIQTFWITRYRKIDKVDANGQVVRIEVPYEKEIEWNFKDGFFFSWGGKFFTLRPGEEKGYDRFLAEHCAKHMVQFIINKQYLATRRMGDDGTPRYDNNILNNEVLKKSIFNNIIVGVEEWYENSEDDFDALLAKKFGGDFDAIAKEKTNNEDVELPEIDQDDKPARITVKKPIIPLTNDIELAKARDEADANGIEYTAKDDEKTIKAKILKAMA